MPNARNGISVGVYVDVANLARNGGYGMRYDVLREFACRDSAEPVRLNVYVSYDADRAESDPAYRLGQEGFGKANADLDLAVDALLQSDNIHRVLLATGDGDFVQVVRALQNKGCRVEILAFENVSADLRREADLFMSGYLVPNLLPTETARDGPPWGEIGSRVRGICYNHTGKGYGFLRFVKTIAPEVWRTDTRLADSPYETVFFHDSQLPPQVTYTELPSRNLIFEVELVKAEGRESGLQAINMKLVSPKRRA